MRISHKSKMRTSILGLLAALCLTVTALADDSGQKLSKSGRPEGKGWVNLIPKDLSGWKYQPEYWKLEKGVFIGNTPGTPDHHYAYTEKEYGNFELHADVKLVGYNSGVCVRVKPTSFDDVPGYQVDMGEGYWGCLWDERGRGMVAKYEKADAEKLVKKARRAKLFHIRPRKGPTKKQLARLLFEFATIAQANGWSAEDLLTSEARKRERIWRKEERRSGKDQIRNPKSEIRSGNL